MSLKRTSCIINFFCESSITNNTIITSKAHISSFCCKSFLVFHDVDDVIFSIRSKFFARCILYSKHIPSKLNCHNLGSETDSEIWDFIISCIFCRKNHPFSSTSSKSSWNTDTIESSKKFYSFFFDIFSFNKFEFYFLLVSISSTFESLIE